MSSDRSTFSWTVQAGRLSLAELCLPKESWTNAKALQRSQLEPATLAFVHEWFNRLTSTLGDGPQLWQFSATGLKQNSSNNYIQYIQLQYFTIYTVSVKTSDFQARQMPMAHIQLIPVGCVQGIRCIRIGFGSAHGWLFCRHDFVPF